MSSDRIGAARLKDLDYPLQMLRERGFRIVETRSQPHVASRVDIAMARNVLNYFNDDRASNLRFAEFDDETVLLEFEGQRYRLFGVEGDSVFIERRDDGTIHWEAGPHARAPLSHDRQFVNSDIRAFARCLAFFHSLVLRVNARLLPYEHVGEEAWENAREEVAATLLDFLVETDPAAMWEHTYWNIKQFRCSDLGFTPAPGIEYYVRKGRVDLGAG